MASATELYGWDLLHRTVESRITREADVLIALAHWFLTKNMSFRCLGIGDDKTINEAEVGSELLPDGWNETGESYALRYVFEKKLYILLGAKTEDTIVINLLDVHSRNVSNIALHLKETVKSLNGPIMTMIPGVNELLDRFKKELADPVFSGSSKEVTTQTEAKLERIDDDPLRIITRNPILLQSRDRDPLFEVGRGDLDPLGRGGGGMLFQPPQAFAPPAPFGPGLPRGPLGARFDPFGPPDFDPLRRGNPNPDHIRPPHDYDDMFM